MKYALISDIHANLPALEAVYADITERAGHRRDLPSGRPGRLRPWPNETVALIPRHGIAGVAGNYDSTVGTDYKHCGCRYEDPRQEELSHLSYDWTRRHVSARHQDLPRRAAVPHRPAAERRPPGRAPRRAGARHADAQHRLLDRGPPRRVLPQDGEPRRDEAGRRDRVRPHAQAVAPGSGRHPLREHGQRRPAEGRRLARGIRPAGRRRWHGRGGVRPRGVRRRRGHAGHPGERAAGRFRRVSAHRRKSAMQPGLT